MYLRLLIFVEIKQMGDFPITPIAAPTIQSYEPSILAFLTLIVPVHLETIRSTQINFFSSEKIALDHYSSQNRCFSANDNLACLCRVVSLGSGILFVYFRLVSSLRIRCTQRTVTLRLRLRTISARLFDLLTANRLISRMSQALSLCGRPLLFCFP